MSRLTVKLLTKSIKTLTNVQPLRLCRICGCLLFAAEAEVCSTCPAGSARGSEARKPPAAPPAVAARTKPDGCCLTLAECIAARRRAGRGLAGCPPCLRAAGATGNEGAEAT